MKSTQHQHQIQQRAATADPKSGMLCGWEEGKHGWGSDSDFTMRPARRPTTRSTTLASRQLRGNAGGACLKRASGPSFGARSGRGENLVVEEGVHPPQPRRMHKADCLPILSLFNKASVCVCASAAAPPLRPARARATAGGGGKEAAAVGVGVEPPGGGLRFECEASAAEEELEQEGG
jgi:hypothetical protein